MQNLLKRSSIRDSIVVQLVQVYLIYQSSQCKMNVSTKLSNISVNEKVKIVV